MVGGRPTRDAGTSYRVACPQAAELLTNARQGSAEAWDEDRADGQDEALAKPEYDVMLAVARGKANAEIAAELSMSVATVKAHISHIMTELDAGNRTQIALLAHDAGL
jgi:DNA-binding NarL/FixJ family response regulator